MEWEETRGLSKIRDLRREKDDLQENNITSNANKSQRAQNVTNTFRCTGDKGKRWRQIGLGRRSQF